jgi:hypothetical protein
VGAFLLSTFWGTIYAKKFMADRICPECGRKMKQQFIRLKHCKCGISLAEK